MYSPNRKASEPFLMFNSTAPLPRGVWKNDRTSKPLNPFVGGMPFRANNCTAPENTEQLYTLPIKAILVPEGQGNSIVTAWIPGLPSGDEQWQQLSYNN